ncbi:MAG: DUF3592 domain-containing protein [Ancalomicrobiaceae bacterium]|nr:DUF3592 domain-containing protein [Ancalomicrobiaceae bacterium]
MLLELELGAALIVLGLLIAIWQYFRGRSGIATHGKVARIDATDKKSPLGEAKLTIRFVDGEGALRFFSASVRGTRYSVSDDIPVRYSAKDPGNARVDEGAAKWVRPLVVAVVGLFLIGAGLLK